ncbi:MAG: anthranilate synthase component I, partial [Lachnospiraceae bacterium]|nr:anthranilate synthase component I [Lachnospiraceae bacterium]
MRPTLEEVKAMAATGKYSSVPLSMEMFSDVRTPIGVLKVLKNVSGHCYMLESAEAHERWGRYTFLGYEPKLLITCRSGEMQIGERKFHTDSPEEEIRKILEEYKSPALDYLPTFTGGLVGYFAYDYMKYSEKSLVLDAEDDENFNDLDLMLFDKVIAFDHYKQKIILIANIKLDDIEAEYS